MDGLWDLEAVIRRQEGHGRLEVGVLKDLLGDLVQEPWCSPGLCRCQICVRSVMSAIFKFTGRNLRPTAVVDDAVSALPF